MPRVVSKTILMAPTLVLAGGLAVAGCGWFGSDKEEIFFDDRLGPNTEAQVESLPGGLIGDKTNARHTNEDLRAPDIED